MKTDLQVIDEVIETLTPEVWIQGTWCVLPGEVTEKVANHTEVAQMCADGALRMAIFGTPYNFNHGGVAQTQYERIFNILKRLVNAYHDDKDFEGRCVDHHIMSYNDSHSFEDVKLILKYARDELEG